MKYKTTLPAPGFKVKETFRFPALSLRLPMRWKLPAEFRLRTDFESIYLLVYTVYTFIYVIDSSLFRVGQFMSLAKLLTLVTLLPMFFMRRKYKPVKLAAAAVIFIAFFISAEITDRGYLIFYALFVMNADVTKFRKIVFCSLAASLTATLFIMACSQTSILPDYTFHRGDAGTAHSFGFTYYTAAPYILLYNMISYLFLRGKKLTLPETAVLLACNYLIYKATTTRLTFFLFDAIMLLFWIVVKFDFPRNTNRKLYKVLASAAFTAACVFTVWCAKNYTLQSRFWRKADELFSTRISLSHQAFSMYHIKLLGQYIEMQGNLYHRVVVNYFYIDSGFIYAVLGYGLLFTGVVILLYSYIFRYACIMNQRSVLVWCIAVMAFTVVNNTWVAIPTNPLLLYFMIVLREQGKTSITEELKKLLWHSQA